MPNPKKEGGVTDAAVKAATGSSWDEWFRRLDSAGMNKKDHPTIVTWLRKNHDVSHWWQQMVTVAYEQARGLREKHQKPGGFEVSRSKTIATPLSHLYRSWSDGRSRRVWPADPKFEIRKATPEKSLRITWVDGETGLNVYFYDKGKQKSQVTVQHVKLPNPKQAERKKAYWGEQLEKLKDLLEG